METSSSQSRMASARPSRKYISSIDAIADVYAPTPLHRSSAPRVERAQNVSREPRKGWSARPSVRTGSVRSDTVRKYCTLAAGTEVVDEPKRFAVFGRARDDRMYERKQ